jgi:hypothetical protein
LLVATSNVKNPIHHPENAWRFNKAYHAWRGTTAAQRLRGKPYQVHGACSRGGAAPDVDAPSAEEE